MKNKILSQEWYVFLNGWLWSWFLYWMRRSIQKYPNITFFAVCSFTVLNDSLLEAFLTNLVSEEKRVYSLLLYFMYSLDMDLKVKVKWKYNKYSKWKTAPSYKKT